MGSKSAGECPDGVHARRRQGDGSAKEWIRGQTARAIRKQRAREEWARTAVPQHERPGECTCCGRPGIPRKDGAEEVLCDEHDRERREGTPVRWAEVRGRTTAHAEAVLAEVRGRVHELPPSVAAAVGEYMAHEGGADEQRAYRELMRAVADAWTSYRSGCSAMPRGFEIALLVSGGHTELVHVRGLADSRCPSMWWTPSSGSVAGRVPPGRELLWTVNNPSPGPLTAFFYVLWPGTESERRLERLGEAVNRGLRVI